MIKLNGFQHYLSKLASSPSSDHSIFSHNAGRMVCGSTSPSKGHGLCTTLGTTATAKHKVAEHTALFGNLVLLAQIDGSVAFETQLLQNWKCQYT